MGGCYAPDKTLGSSVRSGIYGAVGPWSGPEKDAVTALITMAYAAGGRIVAAQTGR